MTQAETEAETEIGRQTDGATERDRMRQAEMKAEKESETGRPRERDRHTETYIERERESGDTPPQRSRSLEPDSCVINNGCRLLRLRGGNSSGELPQLGSIRRRDGANGPTV